MSNKRLSFLTSDDFNYIIQNEKAPVVVFFTASWDENSMTMMEHVETLALSHYNTIKIYGCDIDEAPLCAAKANIVSIPCLSLYLEGKEFAKSSGIKSLLQIEEFLKKHEVI